MQEHTDAAKGNTPLVSVGMPTFNRPQGLKKALKSILSQAYQNIEVIVSDNCSPTGEIDEIMTEFTEHDSRVIYYKQDCNKGAVYNFNFVLEQANGSYFMWAADDDLWEPFFIEKCLDEFSKLDASYVAIMMETQYFSPQGKYGFFEEGRAYYNSDIKDVVERLLYMLDYNYGNLFYSLFKKSALFENGKSFFLSADFKSLNEIPMLLYISLKGQWRVLPQIGFFKQTNDLTYQQAKWEYVGGKLPNSEGGINLSATYHYHEIALMDITTVINAMNIDDNSKNKIIQKAAANIWEHFSYFSSKFKPPKK